MIKLKSLISEYGGDERNVSKRSLEMDENTALKTLKTDCSTAYQKSIEGVRIYRGLRYTQKPYLYINPTNEERKSANTNNFYNALLSILPSWKEFPKRSRSIICSASMRGALSYSGYKGLYQVFPYNGAKVGVCSASDFWSSFPYVLERVKEHDMSKFNDLFTELFYSITSEHYDDLTETNILTIIKKFNEIINIRVIEKKKEKISDRSHYKYIYNDLIKNFKGDWLEYFDILLNPKKNEFTLTTIENFDVTKEKEIWTDSESVLINSTLEIS